MAKILVEKKICDACGADVRPGSLFCYNCGHSVTEELADAATDNSRKNSDRIEFKTDLADKNDLRTTRLKKEPVEDFQLKPIEKPTGKPLAAELPEKANSLEKSSVQEEAQMKTAATMRRKAKSFQRKTVEVVWEEPETAPNKWFPIAAILLILFVLGIFYLAMYLK